MSKLLGPPILGMQADFPEYGILFENISHLGDRRLKLSHIARTYKCRVSYIETNTSEFIEHISEKHFGWRENDHQVVLSL